MRKYVNINAISYRRKCCICCFVIIVLIIIALMLSAYPVYLIIKRGDIDPYKIKSDTLYTFNSINKEIVSWPCKVFDILCDEVRPQEEVCNYR